MQISKYQSTMLYCAGAGPVQAGQDSRDVQQAAPGICAPYLKKCVTRLLELNLVQEYKPYLSLKNRLKQISITTAESDSAVSRTLRSQSTHPGVRV